MQSKQRIISIGAAFNMNVLISQLLQIYRSRGFEAEAVRIGESVQVIFRKNDGGFKKFFGLARVITANLTLSNFSLVINFTDAEWTGKIVAIVVGWLWCLIPLITGIVGVVKQSDLPNNITGDIQMLVRSDGFSGPQQW